MNAYLFELKMYYEGKEYPSEKEYIVFGSDIFDVNVESDRIKNWYISNAGHDAVEVTLSEPQQVYNKLISEYGEAELDWNLLGSRQEKENLNRPRGTGSVFRGPLSKDEGSLSEFSVEEMKDSILYFMDDHRISGESYLFVGSYWDLKTRSRCGSITLFEACSIQLAADIVQLRFLSKYRKTIYTSWCCPIYACG